ncbi:MAG: NUDIX domain-containing protein [Candidatus Saccharimonadales bacterium]
MIKFDSAQPYIDCLAVFRKGNKVAFVLRENTGWMDGMYGLPGGKVEKGESFTAGIIRETKEEVGVDLKPEQLKQVMTVYRRSDDMDWVGVWFEVGQWDGELFNAEPQMHTKLDWLDLDELPENMIPYLRYCFEQIKDGNNYAEYGWES